MTFSALIWTFHKLRDGRQRLGRRVSVTIKPSRGSTVANPEQFQQMYQMKLSGVDKKRLEKLLEQGYDKDEAYRLAYRPSVQSQSLQRPRKDLASGEKPQHKKTKAITTITRRPHKGHFRKSQAKSAVNIRLQQYKDLNFRDGMADADAVHMQPDTSKVANKKTNEDAELSKPGKLKVPGEQAKAGSPRQEAKTAYTLPGNMKVPVKVAVAEAESFQSGNLNRIGNTKQTTTQNPLYTEFLNQVRMR
ncbi:hypothetical protein RP20_CCG012112 [Aedes albopictus]|nr:hypothetical protein RP20_CCG012112 [Aedes albopictus]